MKAHMRSDVPALIQYPRTGNACLYPHVDRVVRVLSGRARAWRAWFMGCVGIIAVDCGSLTPRWASHWARDLGVRRRCGVLLGGALMAKAGRPSGHARYLGPVRKFLLCLCPALLAGCSLDDGAVAGRLCGPPGTGTWLLLYGCAVLSGEHGDRCQHHAAHMHHGRCCSSSWVASPSRCLCGKLIRLILGAWVSAPCISFSAFSSDA